jgi:hypothetical protein
VRFFITAAAGAVPERSQHHDLEAIESDRPAMALAVASPSRPGIFHIQHAGYRNDSASDCELSRARAFHAACHFGGRKFRISSEDLMMQNARFVVVISDEDAHATKRPVAERGADRGRAEARVALLDALRRK